MALGNGNPKEGDKGSNFFWELKVLQGLEAIAVAIEAGGGGGGGGGITQLTTDVLAGPGTGSQVATIAPLAVTTGKIAALAVTTAKIANEAVTFAKMQLIANRTFLGNDTAIAGTGIVRELSLNRIPYFSADITGTANSTTFLNGDGQWVTPTGTVYDSAEGISKNTAPANHTFELGYTTFALADAVGAKFSVNRVISTDVSRLAIYGKPPGDTVTEAVYIENATTALGTGNGLRVRNASGITGISHSAIAADGNGGNGFLGITNSLTRYGAQLGTINSSATDLVRTPVNIFSTRIGGGLVGHTVRTAFSLNNTASIAFFGGFIGYETISPIANSESAKFILSTKESTSGTPITKLEIYGPNIFRLTQGLSEYADDAAAAVGGIPVNGLYKTGSFIKIRVS